MISGLSLCRRAHTISRGAGSVDTSSAPPCRWLHDAPAPLSSGAARSLGRLLLQAEAPILFAGRITPQLFLLVEVVRQALPSTSIPPTAASRSRPSSSKALRSWFLPGNGTTERFKHQMRARDLPRNEPARRRGRSARRRRHPQVVARVWS